MLVGVLMPEKNYIQPHSHCRVCGKAIDENKDFCSKEHVEEFKERKKRNKRIKYVVYGMVVIWLVFIVASTVLS